MQKFEEPEAEVNKKVGYCKDTARCWVLLKILLSVTQGHSRSLKVIPIYTV